MATHCRRRYVEVMRKWCRCCSTTGSMSTLIIYMIIIEALAHEKITEDIAYIEIFRFLVKIKRTNIVEINRKFLREIRV